MTTFWLGGGSGAGKTTLARIVAGRLDLRLLPVDAYGFDHVARTATGPFPRFQAFNALSYDDRWSRPPDVLAEEFLAVSAERLPLVLADVEALGPGPTVLVEGPQLVPDLVAPLLRTPDQALWLLPTPDFAHSAVTARGEPVPSRREAELRENRRRRDVLVTQALRERTAALGLRAVTVDGRRSVEEAAGMLAEVVRGLPGLVRAAPHERAATRRLENDVMARQLAAYWADIGPDAMPEAPAGPFWCECSAPGCCADLTLRLDVFEQRRAEGPVVAHPG